MTSDRKTEATVFGVHMIKQLAYGFDRLDEVVEVASPASPKIAFYLNALYHQIAAMFLLDRGGHPTGGFFSRVFIPLRMGDCLDPVYAILNRQINGLTVGETIRRFRNKHLVHGELSDGDLDSIYRDADLLDPDQFDRFQAALHDLRETLPQVAVSLCEQAGIRPSDVGLHPA